MASFSARIADLLASALREDGVENPDPTPTLTHIVSQLGNRSFGIVLVLFGLPNLLPIPGLPMLCGVIVGVVAVQLMLGKDSLLLPAWLGDRRVKRSDLERVIAKAEPTLRIFERVMQPRIRVLTGASGRRVIGFALLLLAIALMAPIPFFGGIPPGIAVTLFGLALAERDGVFVLLGIVASVIALIFTGALTYAIMRQLIVWVLNFTGMV